MTTAWSDAAFAALLPRPRLTVSAWADRYRVIPRGTSPEAGEWRTSRTPYLREPMDAISDPNVERIVCQWGSQLGKTDGILLNTIGYYAHQDPSPILLVQPTELAATAFSKERLEPTFRESPALAGKLSEHQRDSKNTIYLRQFPGGYLALGWATSSVSLASRPIRVVLLDEVDKYQDSIGHDGDPIAQAVQRTANFHNRKIVCVSSPSIEGRPIDRLYQQSDQRRLWVPCPRCGASQVLEWGGVIYKRPDGTVDLDDVHYRCAHCQGRIEERDRPAMLAQCEWRAENPGHRTRGYQLSGLYSPWVKWATLAAEWITAWQNRDKRGQQEFINLRLGETWTQAGDRVNAESLDKNREDYDADVPQSVLILTASTDVQDNRLECEIVGWGIGKESWGICYAIFPGDTSNLGAGGPWEALDKFLSRTWTREDGVVLMPQCVFIDSGGHRTDEVYEFCRSRVHRNIFAIKGKAGAHPIINKPTLNKLRAPLYPVGVDACKDALYSWLLLDTPGPGYCHFPRDPKAGYDTEYFKGLVSEERKSRIRGGRKAMVWVQRYARNEPLDCRNYARAAIELLSPDFDALAKRPISPAPTARPRPTAARMIDPGVE